MQNTFTELPEKTTRNRIEYLPEKRKRNRIMRSMDFSLYRR